MTDITLVAQAVTSLKTIYDVAKGFGNYEFKKQIMDLMDQLQEIKIQFHDANDEIADLKSKLAVKQAVYFKDPLFYIQGNPTPICPTCWQGDGKTFFLIRTESVSGKKTGRRCQKCSFYHDK